MPKILLVEDDKSLREIYSIRLTAEGYEVISAGDGEEALALAVQQKPDLILSDVMMPKISGFDMLDILRATPETKDVKVIMMTALSSEDQRQRGENLGADRYLVKSQVGIEDVINAVKEVLAGQSAAPAAAGGVAAGGVMGGAAGVTPAPVAGAPVAGVTGMPGAAAQPAVAPAQPLMGAVDMSKMGATPATETAPAGPVMAPAATAEPVAAAPAVPAGVPTAAAEAPVAPATPAVPAAPVETPATPATPGAPTTPAAMPPADTGAAMDALVNETPDQINATWPGTAA